VKFYRPPRFYFNAYIYGTSLIGLLVLSYFFISRSKFVKRKNCRNCTHILYTKNINFHLSLKYSSSIKRLYDLDDFFLKFTVPFTAPSRRQKVTKLQSSAIIRRLFIVGFCKFGTDALPISHLSTHHWSPFLGTGCPRMSPFAPHIFGVVDRVWTLIADILNTYNWKNLDKFYTVMFAFCCTLLGHAVA
jgi:hypothetical protein